MKVSVDRAGRLVIPRGMRAQVGLLEGGDVDLTVSGAAILIEPVGGEGLAREGPFVVIPRSGATLTDADVREQRLADQR